MKFILKFYISYFVLSIFAWALIDRSMEMFAPIFFLNLAYLISTFAIWLITNKLMKKRTLAFFMIKFLIGFTALNILIYFTLGGIPISVVLSFGNANGNWLLNFFILLVYSLSYIIATFWRTNAVSAETI